MKKVVLYLLICFCAMRAHAIDSAALFNEDVPTLFYADEQVYDGESGVLTLKGRVEFQHQDQVLEADIVNYNESVSLVSASGNVRLRRLRTGEVMLADYVELSGDLKDGFIQQVRLMLADDSKFVASRVRKEGAVESFDGVAYTPCNLCQTKGPLWQISARKATRDTDKKTVSFTDGFMEFFDVPFLYFPYLEYPYKRSSGFLIPDAWYSDNGLGFFTQIPYFWAIDDSKDLTLSPIFFSEHAPIAKAQYRQAFDRGRFGIEGSITSKKNEAPGSTRAIAESQIPQTRGHVLTQGLFDVDENWRLNFHGGYVTDRTYFRRFPMATSNTDKFFSRTDPVLTSKIQAEGFFDRDYANIFGARYQNLRSGGNQRMEPYIAPSMEYQAYSAPGSWGDRFVFDTGFLNVARSTGPLVQRNVNRLSWELPYTHSSGQVITLFSSVRGDIYNINHYTTTPAVKNGWTGRFFPQGGVDWRFPFSKVVGQQTYVVSPIAQVILAPNGANSRRIFNEDSSNFEFTDANLFSRDRIPGRDIIDSGSRLNYGLEAQANGSEWGNVSGFLGQSLAFADPKGRNAIQGIGRHFSDFVGRLEVEPAVDWLGGHYRFRADQHTMKWRYSELGGFVGPDIARLHTDYIFVAQDVVAENQGKTHQIRLDVTSQLNELWGVFAGTRRNLLSKNHGGGELSKYGGIRYKDECFMLEVSIDHSRYSDRDVRPGTTLMFSIEFKNLGQFSRDFGLTRRNKDRDYRSLTDNRLQND